MLGVLGLYASQWDSLSRLSAWDYVRGLTLLLIIAVLGGAMLRSLWDSVSPPKPTQRRAPQMQPTPTDFSAGRPARDDDEWESDEPVTLYRLAPRPSTMGRWVRVDCRDRLSIFDPSLGIFVIGHQTGSWTCWLRIPPSWSSVDDEALASRLQAAILSVYEGHREEWLAVESNYPLVIRSTFTPLADDEDPPANGEIRYEVSKDATVRDLSPERPGRLRGEM